ncbi:amino acid decarboxylase [Anaerobacillus sp. MEB173]|uniref:amino acid decarboxylase n=1 Tax=Anaerobacillus sp. MEB173 TaxID=3383345 RepID=UPI003F90B85D
MLEVVREENRVIVDVRERILNGEHPRAKVMAVAAEIKEGEVFEIHAPFVLPPLIGLLQEQGFRVTIDDSVSDDIKIFAFKG